jgi:hypothetical protein
MATIKSLQTQSPILCASLKLQNEILIQLNITLINKLILSAVERMEFIEKLIEERRAMK